MIQKKKLQNSLLSVTGLMIIVGIIIAVNFIASFLFLRFDLTSNRIYSLSRYSKKIVREVEDPIIIKAYFSENLPPQYAEYRKYLKQLLDEYKVYSKGKVRVEFVHQEDSKEFENQAQREGIPPLRFDQIKRDKYEVQMGFMGLVIHYMDSREVIPVVKSMEGLEYDITSRIRRLIATKKTNVGFLIGHDEVDVMADQEELAQMVQRDYKIFREDLQGATTFPHQSELQCLLIIGPEKELTDTDQYAVDQFLMQGKAVGFFIGKNKADLDSFRVSSLTPGIDRLIEHYGVTIKQGMVMDPQCQRIAISQRQGMFSIQNIIDFQYVPRIIRIESDSTLIKDLNSLSFPFVSPIEITIEQQPDVKAKELFSSSKHSWINEQAYMIDPFNQPAPDEPGKRGPQLLGATLEGSWISYYEKNSPPPAVIDKGSLLAKSTPTRMIVVGTGGIFNSKMPLESENFVFFSNVLDWLTQDEGLIEIRSKSVAYQVIGEISATARYMFKSVNYFLMPILCAVYGFIRRIKRKNNKERLALQYKAGQDVG